MHGDDKWMDVETINQMPVDNMEVEISSEMDDVNDYCENSCPSYYKRDYFHKMFNEPQLVVQ